MSTPEERQNRATRTDQEAWSLLAAERKARDEKTARLRALRQAASDPSPAKKPERKTRRH